MQNAGMEELGLDWRYLAFAVRPDQLAEAIAGAKAMRYVGLNLTVPHKLLALNLVDALDDSARRWGAVNTIRFEARQADGSWAGLAEVEPEAIEEVRSHGFNTDADAVIQAMREDLKVELRGARVLLLGAGGAGRVAALKLAAECVAELYLVNRTADKAAAIAREIEEHFPDTVVRAGYPPGTVDLTVNATSLGLRPADVMPFDPDLFSLGRTGAVYDMIYRPAETPLLKAAAAAGCKTANGLGMLLYQGARALEIWSNRPAPVAVMRAALEKSLHV